MGTPEGEESEKGIKNLFEEIMTENFPNMMKEKDTQRVPHKLDSWMPVQRRIIIKISRLKNKERILKAARG